MWVKLQTEVGEENWKTGIYVQLPTTHKPTS